MDIFYKVVDTVRKFIKEHGQLILWLIFVVFIFISLGMLFTHDVSYALVVFVPSIIFLCPPVVKFIQRKTRLKKIVLGAISAFVMSFSLFITNQISASEQAEQQKQAQEKREEREKRLEEEKAQQEEAEKKKAEEEKNSANKKNVDDHMKETVAQIEKEKEAAQDKTKNQKVEVRASKRSGLYYLPNHPSYNKVAANNLVIFKSEDAAQKAGFKKAV